MTIRRLVFVDTETTGLDGDSASQLVELSYAVEDGPIHTLHFGVQEVPDFIDGLIKFTERGLKNIPASSDHELSKFKDVARDQTMVAANPAFDKWFISQEDLFTFKYRMLDIESYAMKALELDYVPSMEQIYTILTTMGYEISKPSHTSASDVAAMRDMYYTLKNEF